MKTITISKALDILYILQMEDILKRNEEDEPRWEIDTAYHILGAIDVKYKEAEISVVDLQEELEVTEDEWNEAERRLEERK